MLADEVEDVGAAAIQDVADFDGADGGALVRDDVIDDAGPSWTGAGSRAGFDDGDGLFEDAEVAALCGRAGDIEGPGDDAVLDHVEDAVFIPAEAAFDFDGIEEGAAFAEDGEGQFALWVEGFHGDIS